MNFLRNLFKYKILYLNLPFTSKKQSIRNCDVAQNNTEVQSFLMCFLNVLSSNDISNWLLINRDETINKKCMDSFEN